MANGISTDKYETDPSKYGFERMSGGDYASAEKAIVKAGMTGITTRQSQEQKKFDARMANLGIADSPAYDKLRSETITSPFADVETRLRSGAKTTALGFKERDIDRYNEIIGELTGRGFEREERLGSEKYGTSERIGRETYQTGERKGAEAYGTSERIGRETYQTGERTDTQTFQAAQDVLARGHETAMQDDAQAWQTTQNEYDRALTADLKSMDFGIEEGWFPSMDYINQILDNPEIMGLAFGGDVGPEWGYVSPGQEAEGITTTSRYGG